MSKKSAVVRFRRRKAILIITLACYFPLVIALAFIENLPGDYSVISVVSRLLYSTAIILLVYICDKCPSCGKSLDLRYPYFWKGLKRCPGCGAKLRLDEKK